jgi:FkbM family methyltransferase
MSFKKTIKKYYLFRPLLWMNIVRDYEKTESNRKRQWKKDSNDYIQYQRCVPWFAINGDQTLRLDYPLSPGSVVFDVGGYKGEFASAIYDKYGCCVYSFEPIPEFYSIIKERFLYNDHVKPFCFGLSEKNGTEGISFTADKSSLFIDSNKTVIQLKRAVDFIREMQIEKIELMKLNIEGAEYGLLNDLIQSNEITRVKNLQVQFHDFIVSDAKNKMKQIQALLSKTHELTYQYEFVWENWRIKE